MRSSSSQTTDWFSSWSLASLNSYTTTSLGSRPLNMPATIQVQCTIHIGNPIRSLYTMCASQSVNQSINQTINQLDNNTHSLIRVTSSQCLAMSDVFTLLIDAGMVWIGPERLGEVAYGDDRHEYKQ
ncbi:hypothetical protein SAMD00019534_041850, partial [Acytostelium subglobosum LB1]|uniref:hypothetical protein n=1 Tax=Acytostelium subglobosum LB1 TaxID=1410327 RepID=UPI000644DE72